MTHIDDSLTLAIPDGEGGPEKLAQRPPLPCFDPVVLDFCNRLSGMLLRHEQGREYPELVALGFWLRNSNLTQMQDRAPDTGTLLHQPLGLVFHVTPANVDTMFIYSWVCALLMGNNNLVRLSSQQTPVSRLLMGLIAELLSEPDYRAIARGNLFLSYPRSDQELTGRLSMLADARVIWGGDDTVSQIRRLPCQPHCRDIPFPDRLSVTLINGDQVNHENLDTLVERLWRDIEPYGQMACSSPRIVFWQGDTKGIPELFRKLARVVPQGLLPPGGRNEQLVGSQLLSAQGAVREVFSGPLTGVWLEPGQVRQIEELRVQYFLSVVEIDHLSEGLRLLNKRCQTLSYWGMERETMRAALGRLNGMVPDRVVPVGKALAFDSYWDGQDLLGMLSRSVPVL